MSDESRRIRNSLERIERAALWLLEEGVTDVADLNREAATRARAQVESLLEQLREESGIVKTQLDLIAQKEQCRVRALRCAISVWSHADEGSSPGEVGLGADGDTHNLVVAAIAGRRWPDP